jgi:hypothetical protein
MIGTLIRCIRCNEVINMTEWDRSPHYTWHEGEIKEQEGDDRQTFFQRHKGHKTEELIPLTPLISDKPYAEPLKASYFEATNGRRRFVIKRWRNAIGDPLAYEIIDGRLEVTNKKVRVQTEAIKKQMRAENGSLISVEKMNSFINAMRKEVQKLDTDALEVSAEGETPLISYHQLRKECVERVLARCRDTFDRHELKLMRDFVMEHNEYDDVMTVVMKKEFSIKPEVQRDKQPRAVRPAQRVAISHY